MSGTNTRKRARVLIVDDHPAVRDGLAFKIGRQPDLEVCGEAANVSEALRLLDDSRPDIAVVDITLKTGNGIDLIKRIKARNDHVRILVWSMHSEWLYAERALRAGAMGYISKDQATEEIITAIRRLQDDKVYLSDATSERMLRRAVGQRQEEVTWPPLDGLSDRELEVFRLIGQGVKTSEIAERLHLSVSTVETYRERIRQKLDLRGSTKLAHYATQWVQENG
jgi:DNA-binding NarL/FixJ family response regulator